MELEEEKAKIEDAPKRNAKQKKRLLEIEQEMIPLKQFLNDAKMQRAQILKEIGMITTCTSFFFFFYVQLYLIIRHFED
jgi:hypothetical protein